MNSQLFTSVLNRNLKVHGLHFFHAPLVLSYEGKRLITKNDRMQIYVTKCSFITGCIVIEISTI